MEHTAPMNARRTHVLAGLVLAAAALSADTKTPKPPGAADARKPAALAEQAGALARQHLRELGKGYIARIDARRHIVYVSAVDKGSFQYVTGLLAAHADAQRKLLFVHPLQWNVTVVLPTLSHYRKRKAPPKALGYYHGPSRTLYSISFSDVLVHEFIHALHHNDMALARQRHPIWLTEGLATLFQRSRIRKGKLEILDSPGLRELQEAVKGNKAPSLARLTAMGHKQFRAEAEVCYRQVRYLMMYLHRQGKLKAYYEAFKADYAGDRTGAKTLAKLLGKQLDEIDADWRKWVLGLKPPWRPGYKLKAHLGIRMMPTPEGVRVTGFIRRTTSATRGLLRKDDVIISVAGQPTPTPRKLTAAVQSCRPGNIVDIEVIRSGRTIAIKHLLGLMPK